VIATRLAYGVAAGQRGMAMRRSPGGQYAECPRQPPHGDPAAQLTGRLPSSPARTNSSSQISPWLNSSTCSSPTASDQEARMAARHAVIYSRLGKPDAPAWVGAREGWGPCGVTWPGAEVRCGRVAQPISASRPFLQPSAPPARDHLGRASGQGEPRPRARSAM
jgi:hypothetical protein